MSYIFNNPLSKNFRRKLRKNQTDAERKLWYYLRNKRMKGFKFFRQYGCGNYILDFYCPSKRLAIELDGGQHFKAEEYDNARTHYLDCMDINVIRFWDNEVLQNIDAVVEVIWRYLKNT